VVNQLLEVLQLVTLELQQQQATLEQAPQAQELVSEEPEHKLILSLELDLEVQVWVEWAASQAAVCHQVWEECNQVKCLLHR
jgi:hypothetical protein